MTQEINITTPNEFRIALFEQGLDIARKENKVDVRSQNWGCDDDDWVGIYIDDFENIWDDEELQEHLNSYPTQVWRR